jgi:hypothetical protein
MDSICAMKEIVGLMDLPNGASVGAESREALWEALQRQAKRISTEIPIYHPDISLSSREGEQAQWQRWLRMNHLED